MSNCKNNLEESVEEGISVPDLTTHQADITLNQTNSTDIALNQTHPYIQKEDELKLSFPTMQSKDTELYPLAFLDTPIALKEFVACLGNTKRRFVETPRRNIEETDTGIDFEQDDLMDKVARKRSASASPSVRSINTELQSTSHKRLCPENENLEPNFDEINMSIDIPETSGHALPRADSIIDGLELPEEYLTTHVGQTLDLVISNELIGPETSDLSRFPPSPSPSAISRLDATFGVPKDLQAFEAMPAMIQHFEALPPELQSYFMHQLLRRLTRPSLQFVAESVVPHLKRDFLSYLPLEISNRVLECMDAKTLCAASQVSTSWASLINNNQSLWERRIKLDEMAVDPRPYNSLDIKRWNLGSPDEQYRDPDLTSSELVAARLPDYYRKPAKDIYACRYVTKTNWELGLCKHYSYQTDNVQVITCLQFDNYKMVMGSETSSVYVHNLTGEELRQLRGHEGGVWTLSFVGNILATGSTDRSIRIWNIEKGECTHIFTGHTSTVRCLQIIMPVDVPNRIRPDGERECQPAMPLVVTGSRDSTLRVWKLPNSSDEPHLSTGSEVINPYALNVLKGHTNSVRTLSGQGNLIASGSYDHTVRVWYLNSGECKWTLKGHTNKVYNVVMDKARGKCMSGSMDQTVRVWDLDNGTCLHVLQDHTSLVGLLHLSSKFFVSAAADATIRIWDPETFKCLRVLKGHTGAIMALHHDTTRVVSGSEGAIKLWNVTTGNHINDLITGVTGVWQIKASSNRLIAAVNRADSTWLEIMDFSLP